MKFSEDQLTSLSEWVTERMGLNFPRQRWNELERGFAESCVKFGLSDAQSCLNLLRSNALERRHIEVLAGHLTIGETYFFRDTRFFEALERVVIPDLLARHKAERRIRIWCAGCSTGEEPYSLAMLLHRIVPDLLLWNITILATDINTRSLEAAIKGIYGEWSFRGTPPTLKRFFFRPATVAGKFEALGHVRKLVTFGYLNLKDNAYPSLLTNTNALDLIICRNVLMYFSPAGQMEVIRRFQRCLNEGGWFFPGASDFSHTILEGFEPGGIPNVFGFRRSSETSGDKTAAPPPFEFWLPSSPPEPAVAEVEKPEPRAAPPVPAAPALALDEAEILLMAERGEGEAARRRVEARLREHPADGAALLAQARLLANEGKFSEALASAEAALAADSLAHRAHFVRSLILHEMGRSDAALEALRRVLFLEPSFVPGHFALASLCRETGRRTEARRHALEAMRLLRSYGANDLLPDADGLEAGRLREILESSLSE